MVSCSHENTEINIGSLFDPTWDFSDSSTLSFDQNYIEIKNGQAALKPLVLEDSVASFNEGIYVGTVNDNGVSIEGARTDVEANINNFLQNQTSNLLGYWRWDGNGLDLSGKNNSAVAVGGATWSTNSKLGSHSGEFNGSSSLFEVAHTDEISSLTALTFSSWVKFNTMTVSGDVNDTDTLLVKGSRVLGVATDIEWSLERNNSGDLVFRVYRPGGIGSIHTTVSNFSANYSVNTWYHIAGTWDATSQHIYVNGDEVAANMSPSSAMQAVPTHPLRVGGGDTLRYLDGFVDELVLFKSKLAESEIKSIYKNQQEKYTELSSSWSPQWGQLVGYWKMDGHWQDSTGNGHHATPISSAQFSEVSQVGSHAGLFNGTSDAAEVADDDDLDTNLSELTVSVWIYKDSVGSTGKIIEKVSGAYVLQVLGSGVIEFSTANHPAQTFVTVSGPTLRAQQWTHLTMTYDGQMVRGYVDGVFVGELPQTGSIYRHGQGVFIGCDANVGGTCNPGQYWNGKIDELALWNKALTPSEISIIFNRQKQKYAGHYDSKVIDKGSKNSIWSEFSWATELPFGKGLVGDFDGDGTPDKEDFSEYSLSGALNTDLVGLWFFNTSSYDTTAGEIKDYSGLGSHGALNIGTTLRTKGVLSNSLSLDGSTNQWGSASASNGLSLELGGNATYSVWVRLPELQVETTSTLNRILLHSSSVSGYATIGIWNQTSGNSGSVSFSRFDSSNNPALVSTKKINDFNWHHLVAVKSGGLMSLYIDGQLEASVVDSTALARTLDNEIIFGGQFATNHLTGDIDEVGVWARALSAIEIQQLYRRGANRIKFQVKSCIDSACECKSYNTLPVGNANDCDGDSTFNNLDFDDSYKAKFIGPGGDGTTYYSEIFNRKGSDLTFSCGTNSSDSNSNICVNDEIAVSGSPQPASPVVSYDNFPLSARPPVNPYFQYRAYFEADENLACSGSPCFPKLTSTSLNPGGLTKYYGGLQEIIPMAPLDYKTIRSITVRSDSCASFQLSPDGASYFYFSSGSWVPVTLESHRSTKEDIEDNISKFTEQQNSGKLYIKAFLETNSTQTEPCTIESIDVLYQSH